MNRMVFSTRLCNELLRRRPGDGAYVNSKYIEGAMVPSEDTQGFKEIFLAVDVNMHEADRSYLLDAIIETIRKGQSDLRNAKFTVLAWNGIALSISSKCRFAGLKEAFKDIPTPIAVGSWNVFCNTLVEKRFHRAEQLILMCGRSMFPDTDVVPCHLLRNAVLTYICEDGDFEAIIRQTQMKSFALDRDEDRDGG